MNGTSVRQSSWVDWNRYVDEQSYAQAFRQELISDGFDSGIGMLIDTSRNGWGGSERPTGPGPQTDVNAYVDGGRIDRRIHLGNWCKPVRRGARRAPEGRARGGHRRLRLDQASGRVGRGQLRDPERRGQGLRPDVRPHVHRQPA